MKGFFGCLTIKHKLWLNGIIAAVIFAAIAAFTSFQSVATEQGLHALIDVNYPIAYGLGAMYAQGLQGGQATRNLLLNPKDVKAAVNYKKAMSDFEAAYQQAFNASGESEQKQMKKTKPIMDEVWVLQGRAIDLAASGKTAEAAEFLAMYGTPKWREYKDILLETIDRKNADLYRIREDIRNANNYYQRIINSLLVFGIGLYVIISFLIGWSITGPVSFLNRCLSRLSEGDFTIDIKNSGSNDEIAVLAGSLHNMISGIKAIILELVSAIGKLSDSSRALSSVSVEMNELSADMHSRYASVADAADQVSGNIMTVAAAAEQSSSTVARIAGMAASSSSTFNDINAITGKAVSNVSQMAEVCRDVAAGSISVAVSVEEMSVSINEIGRNTAMAQIISEEARRKAENINTRIAELASAAKQIGKITTIIRNISDTTNILAINAAIEAAGAGEAGRGFAVVAGEVKALARQSVSAADDIAGQIEKIQTVTASSIDSLADITVTIDKTADINTTIATAVEELTAVASEISKTVSVNAGNVKDVADRTEVSTLLVDEIAQSMNKNSGESLEIALKTEELASVIKQVADSSGNVSNRIKEIAGNIQALRSVSISSADHARNFRAMSDDLEQIARILSEAVSRFRI